MGEIGKQLLGMASSGVSGVIGGLLGNWFGRQQDQRQRDQAVFMQNLQEQGQKDLMDYGMGLQYDMWQKTGALAQRKQAEAAGMNPAMMYGGSGPGGVTGSASGSVGYGGGPSTGGEAMQGMGMMMQQQLMASQAEVMKSQARLNNVEADKKEGVDTELTKTEIGKMAAEIGNVQAQTALTKVNTAIQEVAKNIAEDTEAYSKGIVKGEFEKIAQEVNIIRNQSDISGATKETTINKIRQEYVNAVIEGSLMQMQKKKLGSDMKVNEAEIKLKARQIANLIGQQLQGWEMINIQKEANNIRWKLGDAGLDLQYQGQILDAIQSISGLGKQGHITENYGDTYRQHFNY